MGSKNCLHLFDAVGCKSKQKKNNNLPTKERGFGLLISSDTC